MSVALERLTTWPGALWLNTEPSPSWPEPLAPQDCTVRSVSRASPWPLVGPAPPAAILTTSALVSPSTVVAVVRKSVQVPSPSW